MERGGLARSAGLTELWAGRKPRPWARPPLTLGTGAVLRLPRAQDIAPVPQVCEVAGSLQENADLCCPVTESFAASECDPSRWAVT